MPVETVGTVTFGRTSNRVDILWLMLHILLADEVAAMIDRPKDPAELANVIGQIATGEPLNDKDEILDPPEPDVKVKAARAASLPAERRSEISRRAATARWRRVTNGTSTNSLVSGVALLACLVLLAGCDTTEIGRIPDPKERDITGTYERWLWKYGIEGPDNRYLIYKSVFDKKGYYYRYGIVTISFRRYQYDDENSRIRFSGDFKDGPIWDDRNWKAIRWYSSIIFCIINEECYRKVDEYTGPNQG